jgi:hypothetical protein
LPAFSVEHSYLDPENPMGSISLACSWAKAAPRGGYCEFALQAREKGDAFELSNCTTLFIFVKLLGNANVCYVKANVNKKMQRSSNFFHFPAMSID